MTTEPGTGKKAEPTPEKDKAARERVQRRAEERVREQEANQAERDTSAIEAGTGRRADTVTVTEAGTGRKAEVSATELERAQRERITRQPTEIEAGTGRRAGTVAVTEAGTGRVAEVPVTEIERARRERLTRRETTPPLEPQPRSEPEPELDSLISLLDETESEKVGSTPEILEERRNRSLKIVESLKQIGYSNLAAARAVGEKTVPITLGTKGEVGGIRIVHIPINKIPGKSLSALEQTIQTIEKSIGPGIIAVGGSTGAAMGVRPEDTAVRVEDISESLGVAKENIVQGLRETAGPSFTANVAGNDITVEPLDVAATGVRFLFPESVTEAALFTLPAGKAAIVGATRTGRVIVRPVQKLSPSESRNMRVLSKAWKDQLRGDPRMQRGAVGLSTRTPRPTKPSSVREIKLPELPSAAEVMKRLTGGFEKSFQRTRKVQKERLERQFQPGQRIGEFRTPKKRVGEEPSTPTTPKKTQREIKREKLQRRLRGKKAAREQQGIPAPEVPQTTAAQRKRLQEQFQPGQRVGQYSKRKTAGVEAQTPRRTVTVEQQKRARRKIREKREARQRQQQPETESLPQTTAAQRKRLQQQFQEGQRVGEYRAARKRWESARESGDVIAEARARQAARAALTKPLSQTEISQVRRILDIPAESAAPAAQAVLDAFVESAPEIQAQPQVEIDTGRVSEEEVGQETLVGISLEEATGDEFQTVKKRLATEDPAVEPGTGKRVEEEEEVTPETAQEQAVETDTETGTETETKTEQDVATEQDTKTETDSKTEQDVATGQETGEDKEREKDKDKDRPKEDDDGRKPRKDGKVREIRAPRTRTRTQPKKPRSRKKKRNLSIDEVEVGGKVIPRKGTVAWRQGAFWIVLHWPYNQNSIIWTDEKPAGIPAVSGPDSAEKSIRKFGGKIPKTTKIKMGAFSATVKRGDAKPRLSFERVRGIR